MFFVFFPQYLLDFNKFGEDGILDYLEGTWLSQTQNCSLLKGQGHVTVNKPVTSRIYIIAHTWPLCSVQILVDGMNPH